MSFPSIDKQLAFLVYDSRSGSTLLASILNQLAGVSVSHESRFIAEILEYAGALDQPDSPARLTAHLFTEVQFAELGWTSAQVEKVIAGIALPRSRFAIISALIEAYFSERDGDARWRVVKSSESLYHASALRRMFPRARFIHIVRDGRAVHVSKSTTISTYGSVMEDNPVRAALDWCDVQERAQQHADVMITVRFEDLVNEPESTLRLLGDSLNLTEAERVLAKSPEQFAQEIGDSQRHLHKRVGSRPQSTRIDAWRSRIRPADARVIDLIAHSSLSALGYAPYDDHPLGVVETLRVRAHWAWSYLRFVPRYLAKLYLFTVKEHALRKRIRKKLFRLGLLRSERFEAPPMNERASVSERPSPCVTVVVSAHNRQHLVANAIRSVCAQTVRDIEILIVDDASTDGTAQVIASFADPRIRVIRHEVPRGQCSTRNSGILAAQAPWVAFLDDDDAWLPHKLERQLQAAGDAVAVLSGMREQYSGQVIIPPGSLIALEQLRKGYRFRSSGMLVQTALARELLWDENLRKATDWEFLMRVLQRGRIANVPEVLWESGDGPHQRISTQTRNSTLAQLEHLSAATLKHADTLGPYWTHYRIALQQLSYIREYPDWGLRLWQIMWRNGFIPTLHALADKISFRWR